MNPPLDALPDGVADWVADTVGGRITALVRHVARREAWVVEATRPDGTVLDAFLRLERGKPAPGVGRLERETRIVQALGPTGVPVAPVHGWNPDLRATLFALVPGTAEIDALDDPARQRRVLEDFIRVLARMHTLDLDELALDDVLGERPSTPEQYGLAEIDAAERTWKFFYDSYVDPLTTFGVRWLRANVPQHVQRCSLVQGDTGPVNFMFDGDRVSAVVDFELGHFGDPMEDLGSVFVREFWNPCGGLDGLLDLYERESGLTVDRHAVRFHRVRQNVRDMMPIHYLNAHPLPGESVAWYLSYRYVGDRATIEAIAEDEGIELERPPLPDDSAATDDVLAAGTVRSLLDDVLPHLGDAMARSRAIDAERTVRCMDRRRRFGAELAEAERAEISELLGERQPSAPAALAALDASLKAGWGDTEPVVRYLARKAYRDEWLHAPAVEKYPGRRWSTVE